PAFERERPIEVPLNPLPCAPGNPPVPGRRLYRLPSRGGSQGCSVSRNAIGTPAARWALFEKFGLQTRLDTELQPGFRWIEMARADSPTCLALVQTGPQLPAGIDTGIRLTTSDAHAAHAGGIAG